MKKFILSLIVAVSATGFINAGNELDIINAKYDAKVAKIQRYVFDTAFISSVAISAGICTGPAGLCTAATASSLVWAASLFNIAARIRELDTKNKCSKLLLEQRA